MTSPTSVPKSASEPRHSVHVGILGIGDPSQSSSTRQKTPANSQPLGPSILWRIVFAQTAFCIQVSNNFGGVKPSWMTVSDKNEELVIPQEYLESLRLGTSPNLVTRYVVEVRSVPLHFTSYTLALTHVQEILGLSPDQEWHADCMMPRKKGWFRF